MSFTLLATIMETALLYPCDLLKSPISERDHPFDNASDVFAGCEDKKKDRSQGGPLKKQKGLQHML